MCTFCAILKVNEHSHRPAIGFLPIDFQTLGMGLWRLQFRHHPGNACQRRLLYAFPEGVRKPRNQNPPPVGTLRRENSPETSWFDCLYPERHVFLVLGTAQREHTAAVCHSFSLVDGSVERADPFGPIPADGQIEP